MKYYVLEVLLAILSFIFIIGSLIVAGFLISFWLGIFAILSILGFFIWIYKQIKKYVDNEDNIS